MPRSESSHLPVRKYFLKALQVFPVSRHLEARVQSVQGQGMAMAESRGGKSIRAESCEDGIRRIFLTVFELC